MKRESTIKKWIRSLKEKKRLEIVIAVIAVVVLLFLYFSTRTISSSGKKENVSTTATADYCERTQKELISALEAMKGVGKVKAVIHWESSIEKVIAYATSNSGTNISSTPTIITSQGSSAPVVLKELYPKVIGVIIICQGGDSVAVKLDIMNAVSVLLDVSQNKVNVYAMK